MFLPITIPGVPDTTVKVLSNQNWLPNENDYPTLFAFVKQAMQVSDLRKFHLHRAIVEFAYEFVLSLASVDCFIYEA